MNSDIVTPPGDTSYRRKRQARIAVSAYYFAQGICFSTWASRIPGIKTALDLSDAQLGTTLFALPVGQILTMPFSGRLVARFGSRRILLITAACYALELTNLGLARNRFQLMAALFFFGVFGNMSNIAVNTQGVLAEKLYDRPVMASFHGAWSSAGFTGALIGWLMVRLGISPYPHFWIGACIAFLIHLLVARYLLPGGGEGNKASPALFAKPDMTLVLLGIIGFCSMASEGTMFDWSGVYFKDIIHVSPQLVPLGYASFMVMMASGRFAGDWLILRYSRRRMMQLCGACISVGLATAVLFPYTGTAIPGFMLVGFGVSVMVPSVYSIAGSVSGIAPARALAFTGSISYLGFLMLPPLIGYVAQASSLRYSYAIIAGFGLCITAMVTRMKAIK